MIKISTYVDTTHEETKERLLAAAEKEFTERGFQGTSTRGICSKAGVTTGALYFFFSGKDDLFRSVIAQVTEPFEKLMDEHYRQEKECADRKLKKQNDEDFEVSRLLIDLYFSNKEIWKILQGDLNHPAVQEFLNRFIGQSTLHYQYLLEQLPQVPDLDQFAIHQFVHMQVDAMLTLISHDFDREEMIIHSRAVIKMLQGAYHALMSSD